ncbi:MFS transporter [Glutamicibacter protophormiae]|uniref:Putative transporter YycB n=2 Tax=Kocuria TaxID=57493 RepID=A0A7D7Q3N0_KOCVA|nr:MFS transporter [Kocuria varians]QMS55962.1 putative transporter YycB [Kocuria varians]WNB88488.1 MFS transporter [Glutamicibacter protophormiae]
MSAARASTPPSTVGRGPRAGLLLVGVLLLGANLRAGITAVGPVMPQIEEQVGLSAFQASLLVSLPLVAFAAVSPFAPRLAEALGLERTLGSALAVLAVGIVVRSIPGPGLIWVGTLLLGAAIAVLNVLIPSLIKRDWPQRIGPMTGVYQSVTALTAALASGLVVPIAGAVPSGWRFALGIWAGLAVIGVAVLLPWILGTASVRAATPTTNPTSSSAATPTAAAPSPAPAPGRDAAASPSAPAARPDRAQLPLRSPLAWQVSLFMGLQSTIYYTMVTWLPAIQIANGASAVQAGWFHFAFQACGLAGTLFSAFMIPRLRAQSGLGILLAGAGLVGVLGLLLLPGLSLLWALCAGFCTGGAIVLAMALFGLRTADYHQAAGLSSMAQSLGYVLAALGPVVIGLVKDATGSWTLPLLLLAGVAVAQGVFVALAGRPRTIGG